MTTKRFAPPDEMIIIYKEIGSKDNTLVLRYHREDIKSWELEIEVPKKEQLMIQERTKDSSFPPIYEE